MGEIADMMLDGTLCEGCGVFLNKNPPGYPCYCDECEGPGQEPYPKKEDRFPIIKNPKDFIGEKVHVDGWNIACVFFLVATFSGTHTLRTPKGNKFYNTKNRLRELRK